MLREYSALVLLLGLISCQPDAKRTQKTTADAAKASAAGQGAGPEASHWTGSIDSVTAKQLPPEVRGKGKLLEAHQWHDAQGENLLVVYRTEPVAEKHTKYTDEEYSVELFARQYVRPTAAEPYQELWHLYDAVRNCPFDMELGPLPHSTQVTDLDANGTTETTLIYKLTCRSDVSPSDMKLIMHEGRAKYALRGQMVVQYDSVPLAQRVPANSCCLDTISKEQLNAPDGYELYAGRYENEKDFRQAPTPFLAFARQQWRRWIVRDIALE